MGRGPGNGAEWQAEGECEQEGSSLPAPLYREQAALNLLSIWGLYI